MALCDATTHDFDDLRHRTARVHLKVTMDGQPLSGQEMVIAQTNHRFLFGSGWGDSSIALANGELTGEAASQAERRNALFLRLFNLVTLPFYWEPFEPRPGQTETGRILRTAEWYRARGCRVKGHPLCWHTLAPSWLLELDNEAIRAAVAARIRREVSDFAGQVELWDVVNEAVILPVFDKYDNAITRVARESGTIAWLGSLFDAARATCPKATLLLNDFDLSPSYETLIERCLERGIKIDAIGIQSHMHQGYWGYERTQSILDRFARFGLPLHFTETTLVSGQLMPPEIVDLNDYQVNEWPSTPEGEKRQALEAALHYRTLFAHPSVQAITWWDLVDGGWLKAPGGLLHRDLSPKPAYDELLRLIKGQWWMSPTKRMTGTDGTLDLTGFLGDYELGYGARKCNFSLQNSGEHTVTIRL